MNKRYEELDNVIEELEAHDWIITRVAAISILTLLVVDFILMIVDKISAQWIFIPTIGFLAIVWTILHILKNRIVNEAKRQQFDILFEITKDWA